MAKRKNTEEQKCKECGCSEYNPCIHPDVGPCWWVEVDLCSHCKLFPGEAIPPEQEMPEGHDDLPF